MDVIEKFGNRVSSQALKDPESASVASCGIPPAGKEASVFAGSGVAVVGTVCGAGGYENIIQSLSEPENAAMVSIFVPGELVMAAG